MKNHLLSKVCWRHARNDNKSSVVCKSLYKAANTAESDPGCLCTNSEKIEDLYRCGKHSLGKHPSICSDSINSCETKSS